MKPTIVYFTGTVAEKVAAALTIPYDSYPVESEKGAIESVIAQLKERQPSVVIALGSYSGKDQKQLRIECACNLRWRNRLLESTQFPVTTIKSVLRETKFSRFTYKHGNSWCNLLSLHCVNTKELRENYNFIHIPTTFSVKEAAKELTSQLAKLSENCV